MTSTGESMETEMMDKDELVASPCTSVTEQSSKHLNQNFLCKICDLNFMNEAMLLTHAEAVHGARPLEQVIDIQVPDTDNDNEKSLDEEENQDDNVDINKEVYLCSACGEIFMDDTEMENHCRVAHDAASQQRVYECSECHKQFDTEVDFDAHSCDESEPGISIVTPAESDVMSVDECAVLELPQRSNELVCEVCSVVFVSKYAVKRHCEIVHRISTKNRSITPERTENGLHQCSRCSAAFVNMRALKNHSVEVHKMKWKNVKQRTPQVCHVCNKRFSSMGNLNKHLRVVHATAPRKEEVNIVVECVGGVETTEESAAAEKISSVNTDTNESVDDLPNYTTNAESGIIVQAGESEREQLRALFGEARHNVTVVVIEPEASGLETEEVTEVNTEPPPDTEPDMASSESVVDSIEIVVPDPGEHNSSNENDAVVKAMVVEEGGTISVGDQTMIVEADAKLTGYVLELDESLYKVLDTGEVHMIIEDQSGKENVRQGYETMVTDSSMFKRLKSDGHWYCSHCSLIYDDKETLLVHYRQNHLPEECEPETNSPQQCEICLKLFSTKGNRDKHVNTVHRVTEGKLLSGDPLPEGEIRIACDYCDKSFHQKTNQAKHMRQAHPDHRPRRKRMKLNKDATDADRTCHICGKQFTDLLKKEMHVYNHTRTEKEYRCDVCNKTFNRRDYFKEHYEKKHGVPRFQCTFCDKRFVRRSYLIVHERVHTNVRPYVCKTCGKGFKQWGGLHQHQRFHTAKPPATHFCGQCHRGYSYKVDLDRHMVVHGDKKHICEYCSKPFPSASQLKVHIRTHTGQRPYKCGLCSMCFMTMGGLKRHEQIHERRELHGGFMCAICGVSYRRQASVDEHIRVFHGQHVAEPIEVQSVDLIQESQCTENPNEEVIEFVVENDGTVQVGESGLQVLARCDNTWVDTTDIEKELVEGILASQTAENFIVSQTQESEGT